MFVSITFHPNRDVWRSLFATEIEAALDAARFRALYPADTGHWARVEAATVEDAAEYVDHSVEAEGEQRGEYLSGAASLGYDPSEWAIAYDGYRASGDAKYVAAVAFVAAHS